MKFTEKLKAKKADKIENPAKEKAKKELEALVGVVPGLISAFVITEPLSSSSHDFCLVTELETPEALAAYAVNPNHQNVANTYVRPYT